MRTIVKSGDKKLYIYLEDEHFFLKHTVGLTEEYSMVIEVSVAFIIISKGD
jgi:hypothetical protein